MIPLSRLLELAGLAPDPTDPMRLPEPAPWTSSAARAERRRRYTLRRALIPDAMRSLRVDRSVIDKDPTPDQLGDRARSAVEACAAGGSLYLWGQVGRGKTHAAAVALRLRCLLVIEDRTRNENLDRDCLADELKVDFLGGIRWASSARIVADIQSHYGGTGDPELARSVYSTASWLVIEELGAALTPDGARHLGLLLCDRYRDGLGTLAMSQLAPDQFADELERVPRGTAHADPGLADRVLSRFQGWEVLEVGGEDRRATP